MNILRHQLYDPPGSEFIAATAQPLIPRRPGHAPVLDRYVLKRTENGQSQTCELDIFNAPTTSPAMLQPLAWVTAFISPDAPPWAENVIHECFNEHGQPRFEL
jgi:hypothetical protein